MVEQITHAWVRLSEEGQWIISLDYCGDDERYTRIALERPLEYTMGWTVEDFVHRAAEIEESNRGGKTLYDPSKFEEALHCMVNNHDANMGISWDTVDFWLDEMCRIKEAQ